MEFPTQRWASSPLSIVSKFKVSTVEGHNNSDDMSSRQERGSHGDQQDISITLTPSQTLQGTGFRTLRLEELSSHKTVSRPPGLDGAEKQYLLENLARSGFRLPNVKLTSRDVTRWRMAWRAAQKFMKLLGESRSLVDPWGIFIPYGKGFFVPRCHEFSTWDDPMNLPATTGLIGATLFYGGLHALAWSAHF